MFICIMGLLFCIPAAATIPQAERQALIAIYNSANGDDWTNHTGWKTGPLHTDGFALPGTENKWFGVFCDQYNTTVQYLNFTNNKLAGTIPHEMGNLSNLIQLSFEDNNLTGSPVQHPGTAFEQPHKRIVHLLRGTMIGNRNWIGGHYGGHWRIQAGPVQDS